MISPTLACANFLNLAEDIATMDRVGMDFYHIDLMDGNYVPNFCLNFDYIKAVRSISSTPMDVHIMAINPHDHIERLASLGVEYITTHIDAINSIDGWINAVHSAGAKAGVALKLEDDVNEILPFLGSLDLVLVMGVAPGFAGQKFNPAALEKIRKLSAEKNNNGFSFITEIDGGIGWDNVCDCMASGCDLVVAGALAIFGQQDSLYDCTTQFKKLCSKQ